MVVIASLSVKHYVILVLSKHCLVCTVGSENTAACILRFDCRLRYVVNFAPQMFTLGGKNYLFGG